MILSWYYLGKSMDIQQSRWISSPRVPSWTHWSFVAATTCCLCCGRCGSARYGWTPWRTTQPWKDATGARRRLCYGKCNKIWWLKVGEIDELRVIWISMMVHQKMWWIKFESAKMCSKWSRLRPQWLPGAMASASMASSYNALLTRCERSAAWLRATHLLHEARVADANVDEALVAYNATLGACRESGLWSLALGLLAKMLRDLGMEKKKLQEFGWIWEMWLGSFKVI